MRDDLEEVGMALYRKGYPWGIVSNGLCLTRERLDSLMAAGLHAVTISLDGFAEEHNWLRGNPDSYEKETMDKLGLIPEIAPRYRATYFSHIIGGYAAGYYSYLWAEVLDTDAFVRSPRIRLI